MYKAHTHTLILYIIHLLDGLCTFSIIIRTNSMLSMHWLGDKISSIFNYLNAQYIDKIILLSNISGVYSFHVKRFRFKLYFRIYPFRHLGLFISSFILLLNFTGIGCYLSNYPLRATSNKSAQKPCQCQWRLSYFMIYKSDTLCYCAYGD